MMLPEGENVDFKIEEGKIETILKKQIPEKLYKYYSLNRNSCDSLEKGYLFFSHSFMLNDLMDGNPMLWDMKKYIQKFKYDTRDLRLESEIEEKHIQQFQDEYLGFRGILSLSKNYNDNLMWPHYTQDRGFCLEFETQDIKNELRDRNFFFFPINYREKLETIDFKKYILCSESLKENEIECNANLPILYLYSNKDKTWQYENEWRFLITLKSCSFLQNPITIDENNLKQNNIFTRQIEIKKSVIKKVLLGPYFFSNDSFYKRSGEIEGEEEFFFKNQCENLQIRNIKKLLKTLKISYEDRIYQIDLFIKNGSFYRDMKYKIKILKIKKNSVLISRSSRGIHLR